MIIFAVIAGIFGLLIGSFLNVCIYRLPRDLSVVLPRSHCPKCQTTISWHDNIPLLSFVILRARCRHCGAAIPFRYPLVEFLTGLLFFLAVWGLGPNLAALKLCVFSAIIVTLVFADLEERILPDEFTLGGTAVGIVFSVVVPIAGSFFGMLLSGSRWAFVVESAFAAGFSAFIMWLMGAIYRKIRHREGLGLGDIKMVAMIGSFLGLQGVLLTLMAGSTLGAVVGVLFIMIARKDASTYELPFGSFLGIAALLVAFYAEVVITWWGRLAG